MSDQVNEEPSTGNTSHEADVEAGYDSDDESPEYRPAGLGTSGAAPESSHAADIDAGYDDPDDSPVDHPDDEPGTPSTARLTDH